MTPLFLIAVGAGASLGAGIWTMLNQHSIALSIILLLTASILTFSLFSLTRQQPTVAP